MRLCALVLVLIAAAPSTGRAQPRVDVVVLGEGALRDDWVEALRNELAGASGVARPGESPRGETQLQRDAAAQRAAIEAGADAAVWVDDGSLRLVRRDAADALSTPLPEGADARTLAVISASLLAEPPAAGDVAQVVLLPPASGRLASPVPDESPPGQVAHEGRLGVDPIEEEDPAPGLFGGLGLGFFAFANDRAFSPGFVLARPIIGYYLARNLYISTFADFTLLLENKQSMSAPDAIPYGRLCAEIGGSYAPDVIRFELSGRFCGSLADLPSFTGVRSLRGGWSAGAGIGVSFALDESTRLRVRADVEGGMPGEQYSAEVMPALTTAVLFE